jgi:23S rRNA pseudouridine2605 synthase
MYVHKFLADAGCGSRRNMVEAMKMGRVKVNDRVTQDPTFQIDPSTDRVTLGKRLVTAASPKVYLMLHKPAGYLTTNDDPQKRPTVYQLVPEAYKDQRLFAIGRLDYDTEGLLILTNDGDLTNKLTHPSFEKEKEYEVTIGGELTTRQIRQLERGVALEDGTTRPSKVNQLFDSQLIKYSIVIHEGKKRQVKRMFEKIGFRVLTLKRTRMANLHLDPILRLGGARALTSLELALLEGQLPKKGNAKQLHLASKPSRKTRTVKPKSPTHQASRPAPRQTQAPRVSASTKSSTKRKKK